MTNEDAKRKRREAQKRWRNRNPDAAKAYYRKNSSEIARKARAAKDANPDMFRLRNRRYWSSPKGRAGYLLRSAKQRCENVTITRQWIQERLDRGVCEVTGLPLISLGPGDAIKNPWAPSLDRRVSGMGYTPENTRVVVWIYNVAKGSWKHEDILVMAQALLNAQLKEEAA
jgi:hypothetical protein